MATAPDQMFSLSDEDFGKMSAPPANAEDAAGTSDGAGAGAAAAAIDTAAAGAGAGEADDKTVAVPEKVEGAEGADTGTDKTGADNAAGEGGAVVPSGSTEGADTAAGAEVKKPEGEAGADGAETKPGDVKPKAGEAGTDGKTAEGTTASSGTEPTAEAMRAVYDVVMKPFKANGKTIQLKSPEEAIALMQMGANYTKRMQDLQPHRKAVMMLESNGLLDEGKLSFLIDLDKKDPEAIKKLLKDSGIDPMDLDVSGDPAYREGSHRISDTEVQFRTMLEELGSTPAGEETLKTITVWDDASKEVLWKSPEIAGVIHQQREAGIYDVIKTEVDRRITLGTIPPNTPFLQAYKTVGDEMAQAAIAGGNEGKPTGAADAGGDGATTRTAAVVATRTEAPKSQVANGDRASAASPTRSSPGAAGEVKNPLAMSDEDFLKSARPT